LLIITFITLELLCVCYDAYRTGWKPVPQIIRVQQMGLWPILLCWASCLAMLPSHRRHGRASLGHATPRSLMVAAL